MLYILSENDGLNFHQTYHESYFQTKKDVKKIGLILFAILHMFSEETGNKIILLIVWAI